MTVTFVAEYGSDLFNAMAKHIELLWSEAKKC
jgi:hypothetical protein